MAEKTTGAIGCRVYMHNGKMYEYPPGDIIEKAVKRLVKG